MRKFMTCIATLVAIVCLMGACTNKNAKREEMLLMIDDRLAKATILSEAMCQSLADSVTLLPRSFEKNRLITSDSHWWCSGFFPGVLWYLYENNPTPELKNMALEYTKRVEREQFTTDNHDVGFIIFCSYGNAYRLLNTPEYKDVILQTSRSLCTRFNEKVGLIRSWDSESPQQIVIIDNMMNLEMLMWSAAHSDNKEFARIAMSHADRTLKEHFRPDYSSYHLLNYDTISGDCLSRKTVQGYADESAWARGQAWGLYGYTMMYRMTKEPRYLQQAEQIARFILNHPHMPADMVPYWDFDTPDIPNAERDASAGAIMASAFVELSSFTQDKELAQRTLAAAETAITTLSQPVYFAEPGTNGNFILKHSVGFRGINSEVDVPLAYADYYYVEAMMRYKKMFGKSASDGSSSTSNK